MAYIFLFYYRLTNSIVKYIIERNLLLYIYLSLLLNCICLLMINATYPFTFFKPTVVVIIFPFSLSNILSILALVPMPSILPIILPKSMHFAIFKFPFIIRPINKYHFTFTSYLIYVAMPTYLSLIRITILELYFDLIYILISQLVIILALRQKCNK